ncbi:hypothetical protein [Parasphingorhabdus sp.]|uniref:hypothetical protein n=1 Tax=Parasphingorhabdus sp. TaxID=2709688 RepID=UPI002B26BF80|nr:hypothetical protein [Parasphingorhabdus sp.]
MTLGRSGSSLLMQILKKLDITVVGQKFDVKGDPLSQQIHEKLNPKGYFEKPEIFHGGPSSIEFQELVKNSGPDIACKMDVRHFVDEKQLPFWIDAAEDISSILLSYRVPSEQARSEYLGDAVSIQHNCQTHEFTFMTRFLRDYVETYGSFDSVLSNRLRMLASKVDYVAYSDALNPETYVKRLCSILKRQPSPEQLSSAILNISPDLFRIKDSDLSEEERNWAVQLGAEKVYSEIEKSRALKMVSSS